MPVNDAVIQAYEDECMLQADRLPLVQSVSRREYLKMRLDHADELAGRGPDPVDAALQPDEIQRELEVLERDLKFALQEYERKHKHQFVYGDRPYMERLMEK